LGTTSTAEWSFATAPSGDDTPLDVAVVNFDAEGIENGYAEAGEDQDVELEYATQPGAEQRECTSMTFEVSYDDGKTWEEVEIDREGNHAEAELEHPDTNSASSGCSGGGGCPPGGVRLRRARREPGRVRDAARLFACRALGQLDVVEFGVAGAAREVR
jgi:hypothetical protein